MLNFFIWFIGVWVWAAAHKQLRAVVIFWKIYRRKIARVHASLLLAIFPSATGAATFTANPIADAFVTTGPFGNLSISNYGGAGALSVAAARSANGQFQSVMRYELSAAQTLFDPMFGAGQWTVQAVTLQLTAQSANNPIFNTASRCCWEFSPPMAWKSLSKVSRKCAARLS